MFFVKEHRDYDGSERHLQCLHVPRITEPGNTNYWDDCRDNLNCFSALSLDDHVFEADFEITSLNDSDVFHYNLTVRSVTLSSAGTYRCRLTRHGPTYTARGRMLVIGKSDSVAHVLEPTGSLVATFLIWLSY